jgi:hypothetical protein
MKRRSFFGVLAGAVLFPYETIKTPIPAKPLSEKDKVLAALLENQKLMNGTKEHSELAQFKNLSQPLVRRIYPNLMMDKLMPVQPLPAPSGLQYYLRFKNG